MDISNFDKDVNGRLLATTKLNDFVLEIWTKFGNYLHLPQKLIALTTQNIIFVKNAQKMLKSIAQNIYSYVYVHHMTGNNIYDE